MKKMFLFIILLVGFLYPTNVESAELNDTELAQVTQIEVVEPIGK